MASCPFCNGEVAESLVIHGGTCPLCFAEIPGEETATDPGAVVKAALEAEDAAKTHRRNMMPVYASIPVVAIAVVMAIFALRPQPEAELMTFEDDFFALELDELAAWEAEEEAPKPEQAAAMGGTTRRADGSQGTARRAPANTTGAAVTPQVAVGSADPDPVRRRGATSQTGGAAATGPGEMGIASSNANFLDVSGGAGPARRHIALEDEYEIQVAIKRMMRQKAPRLKECYERELKQDPSVQGTWRFSFVIRKDGNVERVSAVGEDMRSASLEACFVEKIEAWNLGYDLVKVQPVDYSLRFQAN